MTWRYTPTHVERIGRQSAIDYADDTLGRFMQRFPSLPWHVCNRLPQEGRRIRRQGPFPMGGKGGAE